MPSATRQHRTSFLLSVVLLLLLVPAAHSHPPAEVPAHALGGIFPRISPDGGLVLFSYHGSIWVMGSDGGVMRQLTSDTGFDVEPAWGSDQKSVAFIRGRTSLNGQVCLLDLESHKVSLAAGDHTAEGRLYLDDDTGRVLGKFRSPGQGLAIGWLDVKSGEVERLQVIQSRRPFALSPDSATIAYPATMDVAGEQGGNNGPMADIFLLPAAGGESKKICRFPARVHDICWAADGKTLLLVSELGGVYKDIWTLPVSGELDAARQITFGQGDEDAPSITRDGRHLLYTENRHGPTSLVLRDLVSNQETRLLPTGLAFALPTGELDLTVVDSETGEPITARVILQHEGGKYHAPPRLLYRMLRGEMHFYCEGRETFRLPEGTYRVKICRGPEQIVLHSELKVTKDETVKAEFKLQRWTNQQEQGWFSGESHIHANYGYGHWYNSPRTMLRQCSGEDLVVCNFMVANSDGNGTFDRQYFRGTPDPLSTDETVLYWNQEFRSTIWGHMTLLNLKQLVEPIYTGFAHTTNPHDYPTNSDVADSTHDQHGHVNYTHPASNVMDPYLTAYAAKAIPLDVALGKIDSMDVMGSNHRANMPLWYRMLNCGFQLPAAAGTDCFLNRIPSRLPGQDRVYVEVPGEFSYQGWIDNLQAGRTFVTNGPMLRFRAAGQQLGSTIVMPDAGEVEIEFEVRSHHPVRLVELLYNGEVEASFEPEGSAQKLDMKFPLEVDRSGWLAIRVSGPDQADQPAGYVFAHTSPIYLQVAGKPTRSREDALYFVDWIDRLHADIRKRNRVPARHTVHVETLMAEARAIYLERSGRRQGNEPRRGN